LKPRWSLQVAAYLRDFPEICSMPRPFLCHAGIFMGPGCNSLVVQKQLDGVVEWSMQIPGRRFPNMFSCSVELQLGSSLSYPKRYHNVVGFLQISEK
jgi:hypothetical protein